MSEVSCNLTKALRAWGRRTVYLKRLRQMAGEPDYLSFHSAVVCLQAEGLISPVEASGHNGRSPALYNRYRLAAKDRPESPFDREISLLPLDAAASYYNRHPEHYQEDRPYVQAICRFLLQVDKAPLMTVNERSYRLFGDEKALKEGRGRTVLERMGLNLSDLRSISTTEPFVHFDLRHLAGNEKVLLVENLDTFISAHRCVREGKALLGELFPGVLIYGEGYKILSSFRFIHEVPGMDETARYLYFGDLDYEGVFIYGRLRESYEGFSLIPWITGYRAMLQIEPDPPTKYQNQRRGLLDCFLTHFPDEEAGHIQKLLTDGKYIPQEALSLAHMKGELSVK